ncbi:MAG: indolepyruvate ferredoxin oxidoreductase family protein [Spongiibacteraceae bacterium]|nr:indolepyruvate ferredoxin oxidoreductase family protein [Spongiibacteraceae bacterium]
MDVKKHTLELDQYTLHDRYRRLNGRVFLSGCQALTKLPLLQRELDRREGLNTAGFITGYRGSPLGGYDKELWAAQAFLKDSNIEFLPAINEDLAATAIIGTQQVESDPHREVDGVFSIWYGKGPGVDRAGDALKHGNAYGSSAHGGVLVVAGDDHGCVSSSMSHQSDVAFLAWFMPTLNPANVKEYIELGLYGFALSRYSGAWVGFKAISDTVESACSIELDNLPVFIYPSFHRKPKTGLNYRWPDLPGPQIEARMVDKVKAIRAFARANPIDKKIYDIPNARLGIITTGKGHLDLMEALVWLGIDETRAREIGIDIYKIALVWPLETQGVRQFLKGKCEVLVVEEKRGIIESQLKEALYDFPGDKPKCMVGKYDEFGKPLVPWTGELSPSLLAPIVSARITQLFGDVTFKSQLAFIHDTGVSDKPFPGSTRQPYFCSGCPHSSSTKVPEGRAALAGIGCHFMASWMNRNTDSLIQMGGEGVNWIGKSRFTGKGHIFQNLGEGTYFHSGYMAIRQAIAAKVNITYKILYNDAVAMTGGQPVDGDLSVSAIANQVRSEGVQRIAVVSDEPEKYTDKKRFPLNTTFHDRDEMDGLQRELRAVPGVSILIYDQTCAAQKRRLRKHGAYPDPAKRIFINEAVCEGCGDCSVQSNCLSIYPHDTELGRKRLIDQATCNKDYSCVKGFCPSFVTVIGGQLKADKAIEVSDQVFVDKLTSLPLLKADAPGREFNLLLAGIGGTGVSTVGALVTMAAHLEGKGASLLDFTGFAQKGGVVLTYVRLSDKPELLNQVRIDKGRADAMLACDVVVGTDQRALRVLRHQHTRIIVNDAQVPTGDFSLHRDASLDVNKRIDSLQRSVGDNFLERVQATAITEKLLGHSIYTNVFLLGYAWQKGLVPVSLQALLRAIEINQVDVDNNYRAFGWGRIAGNNGDDVLDTVGLFQHQLPSITQEQRIQFRYYYLIAYQGKVYAQRYLSIIEEVKKTDQLFPEKKGALTDAVLFSLFKLMSYKDEYEVARLFSNGDFSKKLQQTFTGDYTIRFNLAPPLLSRKRDARGNPQKMEFGSWLMPLMRVLAAMKFLRGTVFDPFSWSADRKLERRVRDHYIEMLPELLAQLTQENYSIAVQLAKVPEEIRGFGLVKAGAVDLANVRYKTLLDNFRQLAKKNGMINRVELG